MREDSLDHPTVDVGLPAVTGHPSGASRLRIRCSGRIPPGQARGATGVGHGGDFPTDARVFGRIPSPGSHDGKLLLLWVVVAARASSPPVLSGRNGDPRSQQIDPSGRKGEKSPETKEPEVSFTLTGSPRCSQKTGGDDQGDQAMGSFPFGLLKEGWSIQRP